MASAQEQKTAHSGPRIEQYVSTGDSCPDLCVNYDVDIREFVILACVNDIDMASDDDICRVLGLSPTTVEHCINKLAANGLIRSSPKGRRKHRLTTDGFSFIRKAAE